MQKLWFGVIAFLVLGAGVWLLGSCAKQQGPLGPDTGLLGTYNSGARKLPKVTGSSGATIAENQSIYYEFDTALDPNNISTSTVQVYQMSSATIEIQVPVNISYNQAIKRITIAPQAGAWADDSSFRVLFTIGLTSISGLPLDGNGNNIAENAVFDNYHHQFRVGTSPYTYDLNPLQASSIEVSAGNAYLGDLLLGFLGNVPVHYMHVTITVRFNKAYQLESVYQSANTLRADAFEFFNVTDSQDTLPLAVYAGANWNSVTAVFDLDPQGGKKNFLFKIKGGLNGPRSSTDLDDTRPLPGGRYFDGDDADSTAEAEDNVLAYLQTASADGNTITYPRVSTATYPDTDPLTPNSRRWTVIFNRPMDPASFTSANIKIMAKYTVPNPDETYTVNPKTTVYDPIIYVLYVYLPDAFYPFSTVENDVTVQLFIGRNVQSADGYKLDNSGDEVPGMADDDYLSAEDTVYSKLQ
ncbi:hypothetical protein JW933_10160 [candidate division FCPU426 bacterium]|nr:hypothetical protein [candidate division FCPU426 bacterium]